MSQQLGVALSSHPCFITQVMRTALGELLRDLLHDESKLWKMSRTPYFLGGIWKDPGALCRFVLSVQSQKPQVCCKAPDQTLIPVLREL